MVAEFREAVTSDEEVIFDRFVKAKISEILLQVQEILFYL